MQRLVAIARELSSIPSHLDAAVKRGCERYAQRVQQFKWNLHLFALVLLSCTTGVALSASLNPAIKCYQQEANSRIHFFSSPAHRYLLCAGFLMFLVGTSICPKPDDLFMMGGMAVEVVTFYGSFLILALSILNLALFKEIGQLVERVSLPPIVPLRLKAIAALLFSSQVTFPRRRIEYRRSNQTEDFPTKRS